MARFDVHRPSVINPDDYEFVCCEAIKIEGLGDALFMMAERKAKAAHMARTGGKYSGHEHGGNCGVCGNVFAIYTCLFHHVPTNTYVRVGSECSEKLGFGGMDAFKKKVAHAMEAVAGKKKAKAVLEAAGAGEALEIVAAVRAKWEKHNTEYAAWLAANPELEYETDGPYGIAEKGAPKPPATSDAERTVEDMVRKLIKYGDISDKALSYLKVLIERVKKAPEIAAARAAEAEAAKPVPVTEGRTKVRGTVLTVKVEESGPYGPSTKMLVKHADGWKLWGTKPGNLGVVAGDEIEFEAKIKVSDRDPKFGFFARPSKARLIKAVEEAA